MKVYIIRYHNHYDDYKRAESFSGIDGVFADESKAYECVLSKAIQDVKEGAKYTFDDSECEDDGHQYVDNVCDNCGVTEVYDPALDDYMQKHHIFSVIDDPTKSDKEKYTFLEKHFTEIFGDCGEFTMLPSHTFHYIHVCEV